MTAYYNENDPYCAQWLRNLIAAGHIADGIVDDRDIKEVQADEIREFDQCHFFAGIGVWSHALRRAGWADDKRVWTGSCPCQPFSVQGDKKGFNDDRHLFPTWHRLIEECHPPVVLGEQVANALPWLDLVSVELEKIGYAFGAGILPAAGFGGAHRRERIYFAALADAAGFRPESRQFSGPMSEHTTTKEAAQFATDGLADFEGWAELSDGSKRPIGSSVFPLADAAPNIMGRLRSYGNAIDAETATAFCEAVRLVA